MLLLAAAGAAAVCCSGVICRWTMLRAVDRQAEADGGEEEDAAAAREGEEEHERLDFCHLCWSQEHAQHRQWHGEKEGQADKQTDIRMDT